jgi:ribosome-associated translation inhibitor RaiA
MDLEPVIVARGPNIRVRELPPEVTETEASPTENSLDLQVQARALILRALEQPSRHNGLATACDVHVILTAAAGVRTRACAKRAYSAIDRAARRIKEAMRRQIPRSRGLVCLLGRRFILKERSFSGKARIETRFPWCTVSPTRTTASSRRCRP